jgi:pimeloyl-ACP methyl ester carboxylesterase
MRLALEHDGLRFEADAEGEGPAVLLMHGFPDHEASFAAQMKALAAAGFRAVAPRMRGYAPESIPADGDFHVASIAGDVLAWVRMLGQPVHLVGHDWGASIAHAAVVSEPGLFRSLTLMSVPHPGRFAALAAADPGQMARSAYMMELVAPGAAERFLADDLAYLDGLWRVWSPGWDVPAVELAAMHDVMRAPGVLDSALGWYRQALMPDAAGLARATPIVSAAVSVPTLGIVGADDGCVSADIFSAGMDAANYPAGVQVAVVPGAGHFLQREAPDAVNRLLINFLLRH